MNAEAGSSGYGRRSHVTNSSARSRRAANLLTVGFGHACARASAGGLFCWGLNSTGQLGTGSATAMPIPTPTRVVGTI